MQEIPRCFKCEKVIDQKPLYEAICGHDGCPSMVWHGICLMEWREHRDAILNNAPRATILFFESRRGGK